MKIIVIIDIVFTQLVIVYVNYVLVDAIKNCYLNCKRINRINQKTKYILLLL